jgi:hypothetical protein
MWRVDPPSSNVILYKRRELESPEKLTVYANTDHASFLVNGTRYPIGTTVTLQPGQNFIKLTGHHPNAFPAFYCVGDTFASDESWKFASFGANDLHAGTNDMYTDLADRPEIFKFSYERIFPVTTESVSGGILYDFGKETFGKLIFENLSDDVCATVVCGESREEALSDGNAIVYVPLKADNNRFTSTAVAFRYVFVPTLPCEYSFSADYEYLPFEQILL